MHLPSRLLLPALFLFLANTAPAQVTAPAAPTSPIQVVDGYLVVHLRSEGVTVIGRPMDTGPVDTGWATWAQRGGLLWRGEMEDSQGRHYNVRILPGYVVPWRYAQEGWTNAGKDLQEYGQADTWSTMGRHMRETFKWGWKDAFWDFGMVGTKNAWTDHFATARSRVERKTYGWPLAYPWAFIASLFESVLRVPLGTAGALTGTAVAAVGIPVVETAWPITKAALNASVNGVALPVVAWTWQTLAGPPAALLASAPAPARADGLWMKVEPPKTEVQATPDPTASEAVLADLTRYATETATLDADPATSLVSLRQREEEALASVRARFEEERKAIAGARTTRLEAWAEEPPNREALLRLAQKGGDRDTVRSSREVLKARLVATGLSETQAQAALTQLADHPLVATPRAHARYDKTDPLRGALKTVDKVGQDVGKHGL